MVDQSSVNFCFVHQVYCTTSGMPSQFVVLMSYFKLLLKSLLKYLMSTALMLSVRCYQNQPRCDQAFFFISNVLLLVMMNIYSQISNQFNSFSLSSEISISGELSLVSGYKGNWIWKLRTKLKKSFKF